MAAAVPEANYSFSMGFKRPSYQVMTTQGKINIKSPYSTEGTTKANFVQKKRSINVKQKKNFVAENKNMIKKYFVSSNERNYIGYAKKVRSGSSYTRQASAVSINQSTVNALNRAENNEIEKFVALSPYSQKVGRTINRIGQMSR